MNQFSILTSVYAVILLAYGISLWATSDTNMDSISLTANSHEIPSSNIFADSYRDHFETNDKDRIVLSTEVRMMPHCLAPYVIPFLLGIPVAAGQMSSADKALFDTVKSKILPVAWDKRILLNNYNKLTDQNTPQFLLPWCRCAHTVLEKFRTNNKTTYDSTNNAFRGCIATQFHVNKQRVVNFNNPIDENAIETRKSMSRYSLMMLVILAYVFNSVYSMLEFGGVGEKADTKSYFSYSNGMYLTLLFFIFLAMFLLPLIAMRGAPWQNILAVSAFVVVPSFIIEFLMTEIAWSYLYNYKRRTSFTHPFPFFITLFSLSVLALVENGVFNIEVIVTHFFVSHAVTFMYSAVLFFLHYHCAEWTKNENDNSYNGQFSGLTKVDPANIMAYFGACVVIALLMLFIVVPQFPTNATLNVFWFYPIFYMFLTVGGAIWIEHLFDGNEKETTLPEMFKLELTSHLVILAQGVLILSILFYFTGDFMVYSYGDKYSPNGGSVLNRPIYSFALTPDGTRYVTP